jgi:tetratricopeptide (TPR) repeat protein
VVVEDAVAPPTVDETVAATTTGAGGRRRLRAFASPADDDDRVRMADDVDLLTCLARAELVSGVGDARAHLREAVILARKAELSGPMIEALAVQGRPFFVGGQDSDPEKIELLNEALGLCGDRPARRARLLGALAVELVFAADGGDRGLLLDQACQLARQSGDARALNDAATATFVARPRPSWSAPRFRADRSLIEQALKVAPALGDPVALATIQSHAACCAFIAGDGPVLRQALATLTDTAAGGQNQIALHSQLLLAQNIATLEGRLVDAEELGLEAFPVRRQATVTGDELHRALAQIALRREQDRLAELIPALGLEDESSPPGALPLAARAFVLAETGHGDDAAILLHRADAVGFAGLPDDLHWSTAVAFWSEVAARIGDRHAAAALFQILLPLDGTQLGSGPVGCGPASRLLALLEALLGQPEEADRHFAQAVIGSQEIMSPVWVARCHLEWAEILFERGERSAAARLTDDADDAAGDLALPALGRQWTALRDRLDPGAL